MRSTLNIEDKLLDKVSKLRIDNFALILDNYETDKTAAIHRWLAKCPRYHLHFTPTSHLNIYNEDPKPFAWTKTADEILETLARFCKRTRAIRTASEWGLYDLTLRLNKLNFIYHRYKMMTQIEIPRSQLRGKTGVRVQIHC